MLPRALVAIGRSPCRITCHSCDSAYGAMVNRQRKGDGAMNKQAAEMAHRIERAVKSGKLTRDGSYTIPALAAAIGTTRARLCQAVNREFGSVGSFCTGLGFSLAGTSATAAIR